MMNWKGTVALTGLTALAGWLGFAPPRSHPAAAPPPARPATTATTSDIEEQAVRLQTRIRAATEYREPSRNLFRFGAQIRAARPATAGPPLDVVATPAPETASLPYMVLAGVAANNVREGVVERTAALRTARGLQIVREGDPVGAEYRVGTIESDAIQLISTADGSVRRITFTP